MASYQYQLQRVLPPLASVLGITALGGGIYGLANPRAFSELLGVPIQPTTSSTAALPYLSFAAARNLGSGVTVLTLLYMGQKRLLGINLMCGVTVGLADAWICFQNDAQGKGWGHAITAVFVGAVGAGLYFD